MDVESLAKQLILKNMTPEQQTAVLDSIRASLQEARSNQKKRVGENVGVVIDALKKIEKDIEAKYDSLGQEITARVNSIKDGQDGAAGIDGRQGRDGAAGKDGRDGRDGVDGAKGEDGIAGEDGVSVTNAYIDFDNSLVIELSNGRSINAGEILPPDIADKLKIIVNAGTGGIGLPEQAGNSGKYLTTDGSNTSWGTVSSNGDVVGPASATDNAVARFDATTGKLLQNSVVTVGDTGAVSGVTDLTHTSMAAPSYAEGRVWYDTDQKSLAFYNDSSLSPVFIGENIVLKVYNNTGSTISKGAAVYIQSGGAFTYPNVGLAKADALGTAAVIGLMNASTPTGNFGYVTSTGVITGVSTGGTTEGTILYLSPYSAGQLMNSVPPTGYVIQVGVVAHSNSPNGTIYTKQTTPLAISAATITGTLAVANGGSGAITLTGVLKGNGTAAFSAATAGTDYLAPPSGTAILKANSGGALANAVAGTDYVAPGGALGTPSSGTLTNATGLPISTGVSGLGTGVATALAVNIGSAGAPVVNGGALGTPSSGTLTNATGLPISTGVSGLGTGVATFLATPTAANLAATVTDETGSGALVFATSPTLVTPVLGTPTSGTLSGCTVDGTDSVGFRNIPINSQSAAYTAVLADSGKALFHPSTDANARTFTIPANASVAYALGTAITFINMTSQVVTIAITTDTMYLAGTGTTGSRSLAQYGMATAIKMTSTTWIISGNGLT